MKKHTILFLAANPLGTTKLALDEEARAIRMELERSRHQDRLELVWRGAAESMDLLRELRKLAPTVVHFSGHGGSGEPATAASPRRDIVGVFGGKGGTVGGGHQHGLIFQGPDGRNQLVSVETLAATFSAVSASVKLVVLNACYSDVLAEALLAYVSCVIGMSGSIADSAARSFAIGFYGGLGERQSVAAAYRQGCAAISLEGLTDSEKPQLMVRQGVNAEQLILIDHVSIPPNSYDWTQRQLCSDGACNGVVGDDGKCKLCGIEAFAFNDGRELCPDGGCIGIIGPSGCCKLCGKRAF